MKYGFMTMVMLMYHFKGFLIGCVYTLIMAVVITGVDYLILRFLIWN